MAGHDLDGRLVYYRCVATGHVGTPSPGSGLTIHEGRWAYCTAGNMLPQHDWIPTGGVRIADLRTREAAYDDALVGVISAAEAICAELRRRVGLTGFRLVVLRPQAPLTIDLGERVRVSGPAVCEIELIDANGPVGRILLEDTHRKHYEEFERAIALEVAECQIPALRRWLAIHAAR